MFVMRSLSVPDSAFSSSLLAKERRRNIPIQSEDLTQFSSQREVHMPKVSEILDCSRQDYTSFHISKCFFTALSLSVGWQERAHNEEMR